MARITRRTFLQYSGAAGMAGILASHRAPVFAQANTVHILRWNDFVPAADKVLREIRAPFAGELLYVVGTPPVTEGEPLGFVAQAKTDM